MQKGNVNTLAANIGGKIAVAVTVLGGLFFGVKYF